MRRGPPRARKGSGRGRTRRDAPRAPEKPRPRIAPHQQCYRWESASLGVWRLGSWDLIESHFKGWAKPGPVPPGASSPPDVPPDETLDAISGHFRIFQLRDGHRFSTDDVLTAWYGTSWAPSAATVLDLGSGIGSVGMIAAWRLPGARVVTIEAQDESVRLARKSAAYNGLSSATRSAKAISATDGATRRGDERFDLVLGSPPYFPAGTGIEGDHPQKVACRFELRGDIPDYAASPRAISRRAACSRASFPRSSARASKLPQATRPRHRPAAAGRVSRG